MPFDMPLYLGVGSKDPVNAGLTLLCALVDRYRGAGLGYVTIRIYDGARHEILNEINRAEVIADLVQWLVRVSTRLRPACRLTGPATAAAMLESR
jgi:alpha-beta hydrolase superfamily lysophospholipase